MKRKYSMSFPILIKYAHHIIFTVAILLMAALITWWSVFIGNSIGEQYKLQMDLLKTVLAYEAATPLKPIKDKRIEKVSSSEVSQSDITNGTALKSSSGSYLRIKLSVIRGIERNLKSKNVMVTGESIFLFLMLSICCALLYRFISINKKLYQQTENFWKSITHELKTPITGLKIFLQSLQKGTLKGEDIQNYLDLAINQVYLQEKMAENLIAGASLGAGNTFFPEEEFELTAFLKNYMKNYTISNSEMTLNTEIPEQSVTIYNSPDALRLILNNLIDNCIKYCGEAPEIEVKITEYRNNVKLTIEDNGPGLPAAIIREFTQSQKRLPSSHGAGIGLLISAELATKNSGILNISNGKKGAIFELTIKK